MHTLHGGVRNAVDLNFQDFQVSSLNAQNPAEFKTHLSLSGRLRDVLPSL